MTPFFRSSLKALAIALPAAAALLPGPAGAQQVYVQGTVAAPAYVAPAYAEPGYVAPQHRWERPGRWDDRGPRISDVSPSQGDRVSERGRTRIAARVHDFGSGIDPHSIVLRIDGRVVHGPVRVVGDEIRYREDLRPGRHWAELTVRDRAGNATRRVWSFDVVDERSYGWAYPHESYGWRR